MAMVSRALEDRNGELPSESPRDFARTTLRPRHRSVVRALAEAMFAHEHGPPAARLDAVTCDVDNYISQASRTLRFALVLMLSLVRFAPLLCLGRLRTFERLGVEERVRVLERMAISRFTILALVLAGYKAILSLLFFEHDDELAQLGYGRERHRHKHPLRLVAAPAKAGE